MLTQDQADQLQTVILKCRATSRELIRADSKTFATAVLEDDAALSEAFTMIRGMTK